MEVTNNSSAPQGVNTRDGAVYLRPGETRDLDILVEELPGLRANPLFELDVGDEPASELAERNEDGDTVEMAEMRKRFDASFAEKTAEVDRLKSELAARDEMIAKLQSDAAAKAEQDSDEGGVAGFAVKDKGGGWYVVTKDGADVSRPLRKTELEGFDAKTDDEKAAFVEANKAE